MGKDMDMSYSVRHQQRHLRFRVNMTLCQTDQGVGVQISFRTIPTAPPHLDDMNLPQQAHAFLTCPKGLTIIAGSTGSGKSTLLASLLNHFISKAEDSKKILTYESPIEFLLENKERVNKEKQSLISQTEIPGMLSTFHAGVRNAMRRHPDMIVVGETRDADTLFAIIEATLTGHAVYTTLHGKGVADVIQRAIMILPPELRSQYYYYLVQALNGILWQMLVPAKNGGRIPVREYIYFDKTLREQLLTQPHEKLYLFISAWLEQHESSLNHHLKALYQSGKITEEVYQSYQQS